MDEWHWGIDLGGTKIEGVVVRPHSTGAPEVLARRRLPTEASRGYDHVVGQVQRLVDQLGQEVGTLPARIGIGTPGTLDPATRLLKNSNTTCLNGRPFADDLSTALGVPVALANDANCFALAETRWGAAAHLPAGATVFGVILGTGVGGGVVVNGQLLAGRHGIGGEWGHNFLDESGGPCYCGRVGCVETVLAGPSLERFYAQQSGTARPLPEIMQRADTDLAAAATRRRLLDFFGRALGPVINLLDPDAVVLGGGVGNVAALYTDGPAAVAPYVFNPTFETPLLAPRLGDSAGVFGAALL